MKKVALILSALLIAACLCACAKTVEGSCETVVRQCQDIAVNDKATVTVTGDVGVAQAYTVKGYDGMIILWNDHQQVSDYKVFVYLDDPLPRDVSGRVTFKGELMGSWTESDSVSINHAVLVD